MESSGTPSRPDFETFYREHYLAEHSHPANAALHCVGVALGIGAAIVGAATATWWLVALFPVFHVVPGLLGHYLFERSAAVGNLRVTRSDFPLAWFVRANHRFAWRCLRHGTLSAAAH